MFDRLQSHNINLKIVVAMSVPNCCYHDTSDDQPRSTPKTSTGSLPGLKTKGGPMYAVIALRYKPTVLLSLDLSTLPASL